MKIPLPSLKSSCCYSAATNSVINLEGDLFDEFLKFLKEQQKKNNNISISKSK
jgi:hypothetical protein